MQDLTGINTPLEMTETQESYLVVAALGDISAGTQASADFFNNGLEKKHPARVSRQTVWSWGNGLKRVSDTRLRFWRQVFPATDPRHALALALAELREKEAALTNAHWVKPMSETKEQRAGRRA